MHVSLNHPQYILTTHVVAQACNLRFNTIALAGKLCAGGLASAQVSHCVGDGVLIVMDG